MAKKEVFDDFEFESVSKRVFMRGNSVMLMQKEFELALLLFKHMSRPLSRSNTRS
ncbi:response regulator transcription factor [Burkholderia sp. Bp9143]|uniref:response regulator transcription factor n=1 Tax=Burkholderia sp. Bp9143 TaxID=2184574 RepID=UPI000F5B02CA